MEEQKERTKEPECYKGSDIEMVEIVGDSVNPNLVRIFLKNGNLIDALPFLGSDTQSIRAKIGIHRHGWIQPKKEVIG